MVEQEENALEGKDESRFKGPTDMTDGFERVIKLDSVPLYNKENIPVYDHIFTSLNEMLDSGVVPIIERRKEE